jgi:hypothetical protein
MAKIVSKKGKTFADVAKPIQNLIEKLKDRPKSQANDNTIMLLEKQLDDLFAKQEAIKEAQNPQPQQMQMPQQMPMEQAMGQEAMMGQPQQMPSPEEQAMMQGQPEMAYGGYLPKFFGGGYNEDGDPFTTVTAPVQDATFDFVRNQNNPNAFKLGYNTAPIINTPTVNTFTPITPGAIQDPYTITNNDPSRKFMYTSTKKAPSIVAPSTPTYKMNTPAVASTSAATNPALIQNKETTTNKKQPFDRWGEVGAIGTSIGALAKQMNNINAVNRPGMLQNVYLTPGVAPDKVDYTAEQEALNTDIAAAREANRLAGGNPAVLGQLRAEQLRRRGQIAQGQENANTELMNQYKREATAAMQKSQAANADIAKENMYNDYGYNQWLASQRNAAIAAGANTIGGVFNNQTTLKNQLDAAQIMANAHPDAVWTDTATGNKYINVDGKPVQVKAFGGTIYADGGSVYKRNLQDILKDKTDARAKQMDLEYENALKEKKDTYKSNITGLEYKVLSKSEKDLYAAKLWKEAHSSAPTKSQKEATKKAIEGKPTSSNKAIAAVENARAKATQESEPTTWNTEKPSWLTPEMEQAQVSINEDRKKKSVDQNAVKILQYTNPTAAHYYKQGYSMKDALDMSDPARFDESSGEGGFMVGKALKEGNAAPLGSIGVSMLASKLGSLKGTPRMLGPEEPQFMESITRNAELAKARNARGKGSFTYRQKRANEERLANWEEKGRNAKLDLEAEKAISNLGNNVSQNNLNEQAKAKNIPYQAPAKEDIPNAIDLMYKNKNKSIKDAKRINKKLDKQEMPSFDELVKQENKSVSTQARIIQANLTKARKAGDKAKISYWMQKQAKLAEDNYAFGGMKRR